jgi:hypothetical protein
MTASNPFTVEDALGWGAGRPHGHQRLRRAFDRLAVALATLGTARAVAVVGALGWTGHLLGLHEPSASEVRALIAPRSPGTVARRIGALHFRNRAAIALVAAGRTADLAARVHRGPGSGAAALVTSGGPRLVVAAHIGAFFGLRAALHASPRPVLMVRDQPLGTPEARARVLKEAVDHVRAGGLVVTTLDGPGGTSSHEVDCLGRRIVFRRGPLALSRITGVPIVPAVCAWTADHGIDVRLHEPVHASVKGEAELEMASALARWLEGYLRAEPHQLWPSTLRYFLSAPPSASSNSRTAS